MLGDPSAREVTMAKDVQLDMHRFGDIGGGFQGGKFGEHL